MIDFGHDQNHGRGFRQNFEYGFVLRREFHGFDHPNHGINFAERLRDIAIEHAIERAAVLGLKAGRVYKNILGVVLRQHTVDAVARGLGFFRGDGDFLTNELVHQGGFANIWAADDGDKAGAKVLRKFMRQVGSWVCAVF